MPDDLNQGDQQLDGAGDSVANAAVAALHGDVDSDALTSAIEEVAGAGAEDSGTGKKPDDAGKGQGEAPASGDSAPKDGTTEDQKNAEQPRLLKLENISKDDAEFLKAQKVLNDDGQFDYSKGLKNWREALQYSTESRQAISNMKSQMQALQSQELKDKPLVEEDVRNSFSEEKKSYTNIYSAGQKVASGVATPDELAAIGKELMVWANDMYEEAQSDYGRKLNEIRESELVKKYGLDSKGADTMPSPEEAHRKANENVLAALNKEEAGDNDAIMSIIKPITPIIHKMASMQFPREYGKGDGEVLEKNNQAAVWRVLAEDPELSKSLVGLGRASVQAANFSQKLREADETGYKRGLAAGLKGKNAQTQIPAGSAVKSELPGRDNSAISSLHAEVA